MGVFDELRRGLGFDYGPGHWFCVPHDVVFKTDGRLFAQKSRPGDGRRVLWASGHRDHAILLPRSTREPALDEKALPHPAHMHPEGPCKVDKDGWIVGWPVTVDAELCDEYDPCREPDVGWLFIELERLGVL